MWLVVQPGSSEPKGSVSVDNKAGKGALGCQEEVVFQSRRKRDWWGEIAPAGGGAPEWAPELELGGKATE